MGGAHVATAALIRRLLEDGVHVDVLTNERPTSETERRFGYPAFYQWAFPMKNLAWLIRGLYKKVLRAADYPDWTIDPRGMSRELLRAYDTVCVMSEMSPLRRLVAGLPDRIRKIQMIHNDYLMWATSSEFARRVTRRDNRLYCGMTRIAVVGGYNARAFAGRHPHFAGKTEAFYNIIELIPPTERKSPVDDGCLKIVTISRFDDNQKASTRNVHLAMRLVLEGVNIRWTFMGAGYEAVAREAASSGCSDRIFFPGVVKDPVQSLGAYDILVLFSHYEGVPMVVYEAFAAGVPVAATRVSGMRDQIQENVNGWLFDDEEEALFKGVKELARDRSCIRAARKALIGYRYDNQSAYEGHKRLLGVVDSNGSDV